MFVNWNYQYKPTFLKDLRRVQPSGRRKQIEEFVFNEIRAFQNPFGIPGLEAMRGHHGFYKIRAGSFRIGLHIDQSNRMVTFYRVLHRREIYRYFP